MLMPRDSSTYMRSSMLWLPLMTSDCLYYVWSSREDLSLPVRESTLASTRHQQELLRSLEIPPTCLTATQVQFRCFLCDTSTTIFPSSTLLPAESLPGDTQVAARGRTTETFLATNRLYISVLDSHPVMEPLPKNGRDTA
jgi:hypothetical protein